MLQLVAANQINNSADMVINGPDGNFNLNGFSETIDRPDRYESRRQPCVAGRGGAGDWGER